MRIPQLLFNAQQQLSKARIVSKKEVDDDSMAHLENILNAAQPVEPEDLAQQRLIKGLYSEDKNAFMRFARGKSFACILLWTESRAITTFLGLKGVVYIRWANDEKMYRVSKFVSRVPNLAVEPNQVAEAVEPDQATSANPELP
jgi:hypothetical protein